MKVLGEFSKWHRYNVMSIAGFVLVVAVAEAMLRALEVPSYIAPTPSSIFLELISEWPILLLATAQTALTAVLGFLVATTIGAVFTLLMAQFPVIEKISFPWFVILQSTPVIALAPLTIIWFGPGLAGKVFLAAIISIFPIVINFFTGLRSLPDDMQKLMLLYNASWLDRTAKVVLPNALPQIFAGVRIAATLSIVGAIVAELVFSDSGLGRVLVVSAYRLDTTLAFAAVVCSAILGVVFVYTIKFIENRVVFWHPSNR